MHEPKYWRIRMKFGANHEELTRAAWNRSEVGIWYGGWSATELSAALKSHSPREYLSTANKKHGHNWSVPASVLNNAKRFESINRNDWVFVYFDGTLGLAHVH